MPTSILQADTSFPWLNKQQTEDEKIGLISNYLFMLLEQLRYSFGNITVENFSEAGLTELGELITKPVWMQLQNDEGDIANLAITAEGLTTRMTNAEGNISTVTQTANALQTRMTNAEGSISTLTQTAYGLETRVTDAEGHISSLVQTASGLETRVSNAEGNISTVTQTANKINWIVASGTSASNFQMTDRAIQLVADEIDLTGFVTFNDLSRSGRTTINGDNITTGTIEAIDISACDIKSSDFEGCNFIANLYEESGQIQGTIEFDYTYFDYTSWSTRTDKVAEIRFDDQGTGDLEYRLVIRTIYRSRMNIDPSILIESAALMRLDASGDMYMYSGHDIVIEADRNIYLYGNVYVNGDPL